MATLTVQNLVGTTGVIPTYGAAAGGGDVFANDGKTMLHVKNGGGGAIDVTVNSIKACDQGSDHNLVVNVLNASEKVIGPFDPGRFNNASGQVEVTYSGVTTVTVAALKTAS